jgi:Secretion system C-terminal sorting domain
MKLYTGVFSFVLIILFQINTFSQIPNAAFESWVDMNTPQDWTPNNAPTLWITVTRSNTAHTGSFAALLQTASFSGSPVLPFMESMPFPVSQAYGSLMGYYQFQPAVASEVLGITAWLIENGTAVGYGNLWIDVAASSYIQFNCPIDYFGGAPVVPDTAFIWIAIYDTSENDPVVGASALVDDLSFGLPSSVQEISSQIPENFGISQNYPNPFNPSTKINFSITEQSYVELIVYDLLGREIKKLVSNNYAAGEYSIDFRPENLPNGIYIAKMNAGKYSKAIKMTLLK